MEQISFSLQWSEGVIDDESGGEEDDLTCMAVFAVGGGG